MIFRRVLVLFLIFSFFVPGIQYAQAPDLSFGIHLFRKGEYDAAITELERFIYFNPEDPSIPYALYLAALSYANTERYGRALSRLKDLADSLDENPYRREYAHLFCESLFQMMNIHFRQKDFHDYELERERLAASCSEPNDVMNNYIHSMNLAILIYNLDWEGATTYIIGSEFGDDEVRSRLIHDLDEVKSHRYKSSILAGALSLIPGLGYFYAGRVMDGTRSLLINTAVISLIVFSAILGVPFLVAVFGIIEAVLYFSNIYGGINAVMQENARFTLEKRDAMLKYLSAPPLDVISFREELYIR